MPEQKCETCDNQTFQHKGRYTKHCNTLIHKFRSQGYSKQEAKDKAKSIKAAKIKEKILTRRYGTNVQYISESHPKIAQEWHPDKNTHISIQNTTQGCKTDVWWLCPKQCPEGCLHEQLATPLNRCGVNKAGCPFCCNQQICIHSSIHHTHPEIANEWHPDKNGDAKPSQFSKGEHHSEIVVEMQQRSRIASTD